MSFDLTKYIKYCLSYVKLTSQNVVFLQKKYSVDISAKYFNLLGLLNIDLDGNPGEFVRLDTFYGFDTKDVPPALKDQFEEEKLIAYKLEDIYNKQRNDPYTKQTVFNFGYFKLEIPKTIDGELDSDEAVMETPINSSMEVTECPLFTLPIRIDKVVVSGAGKYLFHLVDPEFHINVHYLESVLGEDLYYQLVEKFGVREVEGKFILPLANLDLLNEIWQEIKAHLRLSKAIFDEKSFSLEQMDVTLAPKVNYFLAEDLERLSKLSAEKLANTAITSWTETAGLNAHESVKESDVYFPFQFDKYQLRVLSIVNNRASVVQGPPGTGKSETIANLLCHLAANGKKVLFVSQKAQALKVVKDKLKKLKVAYLYGYLPNPNSQQLDDEDEEDGISIQLASLDGYIEKLLYKNDSSMNGESLQSAFQDQENYKKEFCAGIEAERKLVADIDSFNLLEPFEIGNVNLQELTDNFNEEALTSLQVLKKEIALLRTKNESYAQTTYKKELDHKFESLKGSGVPLFSCLKAFADDYAKSGYDRHSQFFRSINNQLRKMRLGASWNGLPRELADVIEEQICKDISRQQGTDFLTKLCDYFEYRSDCQILAEKEEALSKRLQAVGLTLEQIDNFLALQDGSSFENVKASIIRRNTLAKSIDEFVNSFDPNEVAQELRAHQHSRSKIVSTYLENMVNLKFLTRWNSDTKLRQVIKKLGKAFGKSKKAYKTFDNLRSDPDNFKSVLDLIPIWIMELDDASRIIPFEPHLFDYVLLDEASQCNIAYTLPVMYRAQKAMFFGDSEQMRDSTIMFKSNQAFDELATRYQVPDDLRIKSTGSAVQSVLDIASLRGFLTIPLRYHYRSSQELIGFSNAYFYKPKGKTLIPLNTNYLTYGNSNRVMMLHTVDVDYSLETSDKINVSEAKAILKLFIELRGNARYKEKSIGILSFFNSQAAYLRGIFEKEGFKEEEDNYKISIIEGIQGDEKDIVIYSFVLRSPEQVRQYYPLTGEGGDIRGDINRGRVNVAFSRARQQVHCFLSMPVDDLPDKIWLKKYAAYVKEHGEVNALQVALKPFDSHFEQEFYSQLQSKASAHHLIQNQVPSCGFRIDFVVTNLKSGRKLAVECDGPCHFKNEMDEEFGLYIESDEERQRVLMAAGWHFYRIKYSDWIREELFKNQCVEDILKMVSE
ncbi:MAG: hypothetical protein JNN05_11565 [Candidatus Omnitrophica bacterium]|nr:hypothetical protein [Candidatus Omnitrophota bacterium]